MRHCITSLSVAFGAVRVADLGRGHGSVENSLHWMPDDTLGMTAAVCARNMAALRRVALNILAILKQYFWPKYCLQPDGRYALAPGDPLLSESVAPAYYSRAPGTHVRLQGPRDPSKASEDAHFQWWDAERGHWCDPITDQEQERLAESRRGHALVVGGCAVAGGLGPYRAYLAPPRASR